MIEDKANSITLKGGFHIWPEGMMVSEDEDLVAELELPANNGRFEKPAMVPAKA